MNTLLVVEIVSPTSKTIDRVAKPAKYAAAGIPNYWLMEIEDSRFEINVFELVGDTYRLAERMLPGVPATLVEPFPFEIDTDRLRLS